MTDTPVTAVFMVSAWIPISTPVENKDSAIYRVMRRQADLLHILFRDETAKSQFAAKWREHIIRTGGDPILCQEVSGKYD